MQHVYNAGSRLLPDYREDDAPASCQAGRRPDPDAFKSGPDLSTRELTEQG
jgi:hypothetical protein